MENITEEQLLAELHEKHPILFDIQDIFEAEFGEENVDFIDRIVCSAMRAVKRNSYTGTIGGYVDCIMVRFPEVTVSNENDDSIKIYDLFIRVSIDSSGHMRSGRFQMLKSTYTKTQFERGYVHSHVPSLHGYSDIASFKNPCLGTGPIGATCYSLESDTSLWSLFAYELKLYVQTESLKGGPYINLTTVGRTTPYSYSYHLSDDTIQSVNHFIKWMCENDKLGQLQIGYKNGSFKVGDNFVETALELTGIFAEYFNAEGLKHKVKIRQFCLMCIIKDMKIYLYDTKKSTETFQLFSRELKVLDFKRNPVMTKLVDDTGESQAQPIPVLSYGIVTYILYYFTVILNTRDKHGNTNQSDDETVRYII